MIIKYTFHDNDFTQVIEKYLDECGPYYYFNFPTKLAWDRFNEYSKKYNDAIDKYDEYTLSKEELKEIKKELEVMLKANFIQYITNIKPNSNWYTTGMTAERLQKNKEYIFNNIEIKIVKSIPDQWENGEIVYYYSHGDSYITF